MKRTRWLLAFAALLALVIALLVAARRTDPLPNPNGYDDFVAAGKMVVGKISGLDFKDTQQIAAFAEKNAAVLARVREGLSREVRVPVKLNENWIASHLPEILAVKEAGNTLQLIARQHEAEGRLAEAVNIQLDRLRLGIASIRGGVLMDYGVGSAVELGALRDLLKLANQLEAALCRDTAKLMKTTEAQRGSLAEIRIQERRWQWLGSGWWHSWDGLKELPEMLGARADSPFLSTTRREQEVWQARHDLSLALARRAFTLGKGRPPANDDELVPEYLPVLPYAPLPAK
jgi:hypothetical protein